MTLPRSNNVFFVNASPKPLEVVTSNCAGAQVTVEGTGQHPKVKVKGQIMYFLVNASQINRDKGGYLCWCTIN